jgi:hypothetical protein
MAQEQQLATRVRDVERQLTAEFESSLSPELIARTMRECLDEYSGARIADFVPLFVYRRARARLKALSADADHAVAV